MMLLCPKVIIFIHFRLEYFSWNCTTYFHIMKSLSYKVGQKVVRDDEVRRGRTTRIGLRNTALYVVLESIRSVYTLKLFGSNWLRKYQTNTMHIAQAVAKSWPRKGWLGFWPRIRCSGINLMITYKSCLKACVKAHSGFIAKRTPTLKLYAYASRHVAKD